MRKSTLYAAIVREATTKRTARNAELAPSGLQIIDRRELRTNDIVVNPTTLQPLYRVAHVLAARAAGYVVIHGMTLSDGEFYRTSGHGLDDIMIQTRRTA